MSLRVVFMGTPDFAAASLEALIDAPDIEVAAVFTQPDKPKGRGMKLAYSPVKELALEHGIDVYQPAGVRGSDTLELMRSLAPDVLAVVAYGRILPDELVAAAQLGAVNVHGSLLPKYRGAAPIQWAVLNGDAETGVTTMYLAHDMDAGDMIYQEKTPIGEFETSGELFDRLSAMGARLLVRTLRDIAAGTAPRTPQEHDKATYVKQLDKSVCPIDWNRPPREIVKHVCGLLPWPVATMELNGTVLKIYSVDYTDTVTSLAPGKIVSAGREGLEVACGGGKSVLIRELQAPGKRRMSAADWLLGHPVKPDES